LDFPRAFAKLLANKSKNFREASLIHSVQKFIPLAIAFAMQAIDDAGLGRGPAQHLLFRSSQGATIATNFQRRPESPSA
jgi:hypothetical protein